MIIRSAFKFCRSFSSKHDFPQTSFNFNKLAEKAVRKSSFVKITEPTLYSKPNAENNKNRKFRGWANDRELCEDRKTGTFNPYKINYKQKKYSQINNKPATIVDYDELVTTDDESDRTSEDKRMLIERNYSYEYVYGIYPVMMALKYKYRTPYHLYVKHDAAMKNDKLLYIVTQCREMNIPVTFEKTYSINNLVGGPKTHQGVCLKTSILPVFHLNEEDINNIDTSVNTKLDNCIENHQLVTNTLNSMEINSEMEFKLNNKRKRVIWLYLDKIKDPMNFGAIMRTAYYFGVDKILVPSDNSCSVTPTVSKASSGISEIMMVHVVNDIESLLMTMKTSTNWEILCATASTNFSDEETSVIPVHDYVIKEQNNFLLVLGNEGVGISSNIQQFSDVCVSVTGDRHQTDLDSLNVSVANGILLHCLFSKMTDQS